MNKEDFPALTGALTYLDSAATTLKPKAVVEALSHFYLHEYGPIHRSVHTMAALATQRYYAARVAVQQFLNASTPEEILFTRSTTESLNLVAHCLSPCLLEPGDEILLSEIEHHSNFIPWQWAAKRYHATVRPIRITETGELDLDHLACLLSKKTKILSIAHISNTLGSCHPLKEVISMAHEVGAVVVVDGAQSAGHQLIDLQALDADFFAFSGHKTYGPTGIGVLYGKKRWLEAMPPYQGGGDMIQHASFDELIYSPLPYKFEAGTPHSGGAIGLHAAITYLQNIGLEKIHAHEMALFDELKALLQTIPQVELVGSPRVSGPLLSMSFKNRHPLDVTALLDLKGVAVRTGHLCSQPTLRRFQKETLLRVSLGLYNEPVDIYTFADALKEILN